jgi:enoyl-CoA hydratase
MNHPVRIQHDGNVAVVHLDDGRGNALGTPTLRALCQAADSVRDADAVLLLGRPRVFCGGLDLHEAVPLSREKMLEFIGTFHQTFRRLFALERPLIVGAAGSAVAGGAILLATGDVRLGTRDGGWIGVNEVRLGIPFPSSAFEIVRCALSHPHANRALLLGELVNKETALAQGWLHELVEPTALFERAHAVARNAALAPRSATTEVKRALRAEYVARIDAHKDTSHRAFVDAWTSTEAQARLNRVLETLNKSKTPA